MALCAPLGHLGQGVRSLIRAKNRFALVENAVNMIDGALARSA